MPKKRKRKASPAPKRSVISRKKQRLRSLEERIGQLEVHIHKECPIPFLSNFVIQRLSDKLINSAIAKRLAWLRANNEKERMGRRRY
jgi:hypothetical protein